MSAVTAASLATQPVPRGGHLRLVPPLPAQPARPRLRLTRRGRAVFTTLAAAPLVIAAVLSMISGGDAAASLENGSAAFEYVTVEPGQSLWSIAESIAPTVDPREVVADFVSLNQLGGADVEPGERLAIPMEYAG